MNLTGIPYDMARWLRLATTTVDVAMPAPWLSWWLARYCGPFGTVLFVCPGCGHHVSHCACRLT